MSDKYASGSSPHVIGIVMLFIQLADLHVRVLSHIGDRLPVPLLGGTYITDRFFKGISSVERPVVFIWSRPVAITSEYTAQLDPLTVLQSESYTESNLDSHTYINDYLALI